MANLRRKVCDQIFMKHSDDAASVQMMVNELYNEKYNPVLHFKPQHIPAPDYPSLPNDVFVFALQTQWQRELYDKFSQAILCIDSTHGTNPYKFKLVTCIVPDDFGKGIVYVHACTCMYFEWIFHYKIMYIRMYCIITFFTTKFVYMYNTYTHKYLHVYTMHILEHAHFIHVCYVHLQVSLWHGALQTMRPVK